MKGDLDQLITSGEYSPTTFNIAFLMHTLFRGEDEEDAAADQSFLAMDRKALQARASAATAVAIACPRRRPHSPLPSRPRRARSPPSFGMLEAEPDRKGLFIGLGAAAGVLPSSVLSYFAFFRSKGPSQTETAAREQLAKMQQEQQAMSAKLKSLEDEKSQLAAQVENAKTTEEKQKAQKALEEAQKKLQAQKDEQKRLATPQPCFPPPRRRRPPAPSQVARDPSRHPRRPLRRRRRRAAALPSAPPPPARAPAPAAAETNVKPGDFVEMWGLDVKPKQINDLRVDTPSAARQTPQARSMWRSPSTRRAKSRAPRSSRASARISGSTGPARRRP